MLCCFSFSSCDVMFESKSTKLSILRWRKLFPLLFSKLGNTFHIGWVEWVRWVRRLKCSIIFMSNKIKLKPFDFRLSCASHSQQHLYVSYSELRSIMTLPSHSAKVPRVKVYVFMSCLFHPSPTTQSNPFHPLTHLIRLSIHPKFHSCLSCIGKLFG